MKKNKTLHKAFLEEIDKMMMIAELQLEEEIIKDKEYRKIMFLLIDKTEDYMKNLDRIKLPEINIKNYKEIDLVRLTDMVFCTG